MVPWAKWIVSEITANEKAPQDYKSCPSWDYILAFIYLDVIMLWRQAISFAHPHSLPLLTVLGQNTFVLPLLTAYFYFLLMIIIFYSISLVQVKPLKYIVLCVSTRTGHKKISALKYLFQVLILLFSNVDGKTHSETFWKATLNWMVWN